MIQCSRCHKNEDHLKTIQLAFELALNALGDETQASLWMSTPNAAFKERTPLYMCIYSEGSRVIEYIESRRNNLTFDRS